MPTSAADPTLGAPSRLESAVAEFGAVAGGEWWRAGEGDLHAVLAATGALRHRLARIEATVLAEAIQRGHVQARAMGRSTTSSAPTA